MSLLSKAFKKVGSVFSSAPKISVPLAAQGGTPQQQAAAKQMMDIMKAGGKATVTGFGGGKVVNRLGALDAELTAASDPSKQPGAGGEDPFARGRREALATVGPTGSALEAALRKRTQDQYAALTEEMNARGIDPRVGVFADTLNKRLSSASAEAELGQQRERSDLARSFTGMLMGKQSEDAQRAQDAWENEQTAKLANAERKRKGKGSLIGGIIGGVGGFALGGPAGALKGAGMGSSIGGGS